MTKVMQMTGRTIEGLEQVWADREWAETLLSNHFQGIGVDPDEYAAANTPEEALNVPGLLPVGWADLRDKYIAHNSFLAELAGIARRDVRIATGHEKIKSLI
jgi:hypothetical protein